MKTSITKPLVQFVLVTTLLTILFRISLSELLNNQMWSLVFIPPVIYFILMYVSGRFFGIKEYEYLPIGDIGFRFHLSSFVVFFTQQSKSPIEGEELDGENAKNLEVSIHSGNVHRQCSRRARHSPTGGHAHDSHGNKRVKPLGGNTAQE